MIFYKVNGAFPFLVATQVEAKRAARDCKCSWEQVDIPTDKGGLMDYLNTHGPAEAVVIVSGEPSEFDVTDDEPIIEHHSPKIIVGDRPIEPPKTPTRTTNEIVSFILDDAKVNQCADIFAALGQRFKELADGKA